MDLLLWLWWFVFLNQANLSDSPLEPLNPALEPLNPLTSFSTTESVELSPEVGKIEVVEVDRFIKGGNSFAPLAIPPEAASSKVVPLMISSGEIKR